MNEKETKRNLFLKNWNAFQKGEPVSTHDIRKEILDGWIRSREYGVDPYSDNFKKVPEGDLSDRCKRKQELINVAAPYMQKLFEIVRESRFIVVLADEQGIVLESFGDKVMLERPEASVPGANRSEAALGSNAIGTSLYLAKPIQIGATENYSKCGHLWTCSAAPIRDPKGNVIGCIDLSGYWLDAHPHTLGMVIASADAIQRQLRLEETNKTNLFISRLQHATLASIAEGILVYDHCGIILQANSYVTKLIGINMEKLIGENIHKLLKWDINFAEIMKSGEELNDFEVRFYVNRRQKNCYVTRTNFVNDQGFLVHVLVLKENQQVRSLINKSIGSRAMIDFDSIIGVSQKHKNTVKLAKTVAKSSSTILLRGESGTGKEMFAQAIHNFSNRSDKPFISINCGAVPRNLIESELFGYESGAFTGSRKEGYMGKFELADGGTLFLDEIGDMPFGLQVVLLRVLENKEIVRIGGYKAKKVDVRIIAATNADLEKAIANNTFRRDLFYRLNVLPIRLPPLRERIEDIRPLALHFIGKYNQRLDKDVMGIDEDAMQILEDYSWPGNARELENVLEGAMNISSDSRITAVDISNYIRTDFTNNIPHISQRSRVINKDTILNEIKATRGNVRKTAINLGISRSTLYRIIKKYGIDINSYR